MKTVKIRSVFLTNEGVFPWMVLEDCDQILLLLGGKWGREGNLIVFLYFSPLYIFLIYGVFFNKVLQDCIINLIVLDGECKTIFPHTIYWDLYQCLHLTWSANYFPVPTNLSMKQR